MTQYQFHSLIKYMFPSIRIQLHFGVPWSQRGTVMVANFTENSNATHTNEAQKLVHRDPVTTLIVGNCDYWWSGRISVHYSIIITFNYCPKISRSQLRNNGIHSLWISDIGNCPFFSSNILRNLVLLYWIGCYIVLLNLYIIYYLPFRKTFQQGKWTIISSQATL